jgi:hypothetical protein
VTGGCSSARNLIAEQDLSRPPRPARLRAGHAQDDEPRVGEPDEQASADRRDGEQSKSRRLERRTLTPASSARCASRPLIDPCQANRHGGARAHLTGDGKDDEYDDGGRQAADHGAPRYSLQSHQ